ncbi:hypothetical protein [Campylobacter sp. LH-2024]|uniref:hypothetical protein n=1 Tax=Campylobacter sp. LH-2024 TaxID=3239825 RepID=UPI003B82B15E
MIGRFIGSFIMTKIAPNKCLAFNSIINICLIIIAILIGGKIAMIALLVIGLFNSIMFPTIFSLATKKLGKFTSKASGLISMAIVGGALIPPVQGLVADYFNLLISYIVPLLCYFYILFFAFERI